MPDSLDPLRAWIAPKSSDSPEGVVTSSRSAFDRPLLRLTRLRFGHERDPIRKHDVIVLLNTGTTTLRSLRSLALSTIVDVEACEYPDSQKDLIVTGHRGERRLRKMFRAENTVDSYDRESNEERPR